MSQKNSGMNFLIRDAHGQPQMVKVLHSQASKPSSNQIQMPSNFKNLFKVPGAPDSPAGTATVYRTLNVTGLKPVSKLVHVPMQQHLQKVNVGIASAPGQSPGTVKKVQTQSVSGIQKIVNTVPKMVQASPKQIMQVTPEVDSKSHISPILSHNSRKRHDSESESLTEYTSKRRRAAEKVGKGLRHFSMKVCEKVRRKGFTSYNEVADELVTEFAAGIHSSPDNQQYDQKNIRRRVYDALNVLMAMNIISKEKKEIRWLGLPTNSIQECSSLEKEKKIKLDRIRQKTQQLHDLILQIISFKSLVERNKLAESKGLTPSASSAIQLPFIVVNTSDQALIDCSISNDKMEYMFQFNERFQIHDDIEILKRMGLLYGLEKGECSEADIQRAKNMVPKSLEHYIDQIGRGVNIQMEDLQNVTIKTEADIDESNLDEEEEGEVDADGDGFGTNSNYSDDDDEEEEEDQDSSSEVDVN